MATVKITREQKEAFKQTKFFFDKLSKQYGFNVAKWAFNRKLNWERVSLEKRKRDLEVQLEEVNEDLKD